MAIQSPAPTKTWRGPSFSIQVLIGLAVGVALGAIARTMAQGNWLTTTLSQVGSLFVQVLTVIVAPLIVTSIISSVANLRNVANAAKLAGKTLLWFAITALIAVTIGIVLGLTTNPGGRATFDPADAAAPGRTGGWLDFLTGLFPRNFFGLTGSTSVSTAESGAVSASTTLGFNVLQLIVIALALGIAALRVGKKADVFLAFNASALAIVQKVLWWVIRLAPLGTAGLIGRAVATYGWDLLGNLAVFSIDIYIGLALVLFVVYPVILKLNGLSPLKYFRGAWPAIQLAFVSRSSIGTLPVTEQVTTRNLGVPTEYASFAVPLGATTKMDGCAAIYPAIAAIFVAQAFQVPLGAIDYILIAFVSVVGSTATAGLTGATVMLTLTLSTLGLPLEGVGLLLAIDPILDMGRTAVNVAGQALVPTIVAKRSGILDLERYNAPNVRNILGGAAEDRDLVGAVA
jgi:Na+/H+-dicarboxylate symporter